MPVSARRHRQPPPARPARPGRLARGHRRARPLVALPGAAATADALRAEGSAVTDVPDAAAAAAPVTDVVVLAAPRRGRGRTPRS